LSLQAYFVKWIEVGTTDVSFNTHEDRARPWHLSCREFTDYCGWGSCCTCAQSVALVKSQICAEVGLGALVFFLGLIYFSILIFCACAMFAKYYIAFYLVICF